jgi:hypothetical protein
MVKMANVHVMRMAFDLIPISKRWKFFVGEEVDVGRVCRIFGLRFVDVPVGSKLLSLAGVKKFTGYVPLQTLTSRCIPDTIPYDLKWLLDLELFFGVDFYSGCGPDTGAIHRGIDVMLKAGMEIPLQYFMFAFIKQTYNLRDNKEEGRLLRLKLRQIKADNVWSINMIVSLGLDWKGKIWMILLRISSSCSRKRSTCIWRMGC